MASSRSTDLPKSRDLTPPPLRINTDVPNPACPPGLAPQQDEAYWHHLREMWSSSLEHPPSPSSAASSIPDEDKEHLADVDLRTSRAQALAFRLSLPTRIAADTQEANRPRPHSTSPRTRKAPPPPLNLTAATAMGSMRPVSGIGAGPATPGRGRRVFAGIHVTTTTTTKGGYHDPAPAYTPRAGSHEHSFGLDSFSQGKEQSKLEKLCQSISCKWMFILGFFFPLLWIVGALPLFVRDPNTSASHPISSQLERGGSFHSKFRSQAEIDAATNAALQRKFAKWCAYALGAVFCIVPIIACAALILPNVKEAVSAVAVPVPSGEVSPGTIFN